MVYNGLEIRTYGEFTSCCITSKKYGDENGRRYNVETDYISTVWNSDDRKEFVQNFDAESERCWVAEMNNEIVGSVFVVRHDETTAKLRLLYVEEAARGLGLGRTLVDEVVQFSRDKGYKKLVLWTNSVLGSARHIYEDVGFELIDEAPHHSFGHDLMGQTWSLDL